MPSLYRLSDDEFAIARAKVLGRQLPNFRVTWAVPNGEIFEQDFLEWRSVAKVVEAWRDWHGLKVEDCEEWKIEKV